MQNSAMSAAKTPDENFLQNVDSEMTAQADRTYISEMEIMKQRC
jgi:hypothetical protein